jgi:hypothetical protein
MPAAHKPNPAARLSTEGLLKLVSGVAQRLARLSRDPKVRDEALKVGQAVGGLLKAIRESGTGVGDAEPEAGPSSQRKRP